MAHRRKALPTGLVAYLRVSTAEQAHTGLGLAAQRRSIEQYAELYGLQVERWVVDDGYSAKDLDRPGVQELLGMLDRKQVSGVIVAKLDRLSRSVRDVGALVERYFASDRSRLVSVGEQLDTTSAAGRLVLNVLASVGQWEREAIGERTKAALAVKRRNGERTGGIPYGSRLAPDGSTLIPDPEEQETLQRILELREAGLSYDSIVTVLDRNDVRARGSRWHATTVRRVLLRAGSPTAS
jgi:site-specific DNA recombinase